MNGGSTAEGKTDRSGMVSGAEVSSKCGFKSLESSLSGPEFGVEAALIAGEDVGSEVGDFCSGSGSI